MHTATTTLHIDGDEAFAEMSAEWSYTVDPGYRQTRTEPGEGPSVQDLSLRLTVDGTPVADVPDWLFAVLRPTDDWLLERAREDNEAAACDAADYRRGMQLEDAA